MIGGYDGVLLGEYADDEGGFAVLSDDDRRRHLYILGRTGTGKTTLIQSMIYSDTEHGRGYALLDPKGDIAELIADTVPPERENDAIYIDPTDAAACVAINPIHAVGLDERPLVASQIVDICSHIWNLSPEETPRLIYILYNALRLLLDAPAASLLGLQRLLSDAGYRQTLLMTCLDPAVRNYWEIEFAALTEKDAAAAVGSVQNKIGMLLAGPLRNVLGQVTPSLDFRSIIDNGKMVIFNLSKSRLGEGPSHLLGAFIVSAFVQAAESRADIPEEERRDFTAYADEFQNYATRALLMAITEARKWRFSWVLAHQLLAQLPPSLAQSVIGTVGSTVAFRIAGSDVYTVQAELENVQRIYDQSRLAHLNIAEPLNLTATPNFQAYMRLLDHGAPTKTRLVNIPFPQPMVTGRFKAIRNRSRARHMRPRSVVEEDIARFLVPTDRRKKVATRSPWPSSLRVLRNALTRALREHETAITIGSTTVAAVDIKYVRETFLALHVADGVTAEERQAEREKAFRRASQAAQRLRLLGGLERDGTQWIWLMQ